MLGDLSDGRRAWCVALLLLPAWVGAADPPADEKKDRGDIEIALRWRYEEVSQDAFAEDARASTLRTTLAYRSPLWHRLGAYAEFEDVSDVGLDDEHANGGAGSLNNGVTGRPVIADPELTEVNQAYFRYRDAENLTVDAGRMEILFADERFVGPVGFRQNHQSFDGALASITAIPRTTVFLGFIQNVNRINGANQGMDSYLLDVPIDLGKRGKLAPYALWLDYNSSADEALSTGTYGARWDGKVRASKNWSFPIHAEAALQRDAADNPADVDTHYGRLEAGLARDGLSFGLGWELLGSDAGAGAFQTPLATLHRFNGWADLFLTTPPDGIVDTYATAAGKVNALSWSVTYHDFDADAGSASYGSELDAEIVWKPPWKQVFSLTYAAYRSDTFASDTDKLWLTTSYKFGARL